jgi:hypothetical protein
MIDLVQLTRDNGIAVITINNPRSTLRAPASPKAFQKGSVGSLRTIAS